MSNILKHPIRQVQVMRICFQCVLFLFVFLGFDAASAEDPQDLAAMQSEPRHALVIGNSA